jgi:arabinogalactan oligomer/maltooligosaccharide transport system permease protein
MSSTVHSLASTTRSRKILGTILVHLWLALLAVTIIVPLLWMIIASFTEGKLLSGVSLIPDFSKFSLEHYVYLFTYKSQDGQPLSDFLSSFLRSLEVAVLNTVVVVLFSTMAAYVFSRFRFKGRKPLLILLLLLQMFPSFMGMIALFMIFRNFGWLNQPLYFVTFYVASAVPYNVYLIRGYMRNIPMSLDEAARIDGASNLTVFFRIIFPLSVPILGFVAVNAFMQPWLDYIIPSQLLTPGKADTVALTIFRMTDPYETLIYNPMNFMAAGLLLTIPIVIVNLLSQRFIIYGMTSGADKG